MKVRTITKELRLPYPPEAVWSFLLTEASWEHWWYGDEGLTEVEPAWESGATMVFGSEWAPCIEDFSPPTTLGFGGNRFHLADDEGGGCTLQWANSRPALTAEVFDPRYEMDEEIDKELGEAMEIAMERFAAALGEFDAGSAESLEAPKEPEPVPADPQSPDPTSAESAAEPLPREIRVFVSSTFKDLQAERDELSKRTFIELRRLCEERGVAWTDVDLRWGITDEQKAEGKVLPICLEEIDNCRPYFIGILGERYGWVPDELPKEQVDRIPWLAEGRGRSVTEMEIVHGVLNDPDMAAHAFFYFRDPEYIETLPPEERPGHLEGPTPEEVRELGHWTAEERASGRRQRLADLKARIEKSGLVVRRFRNPRELAELVAEDLKKVVDTQFPAESSPGRREASAQLHEGVILEARRAFVPRPSITRRLDEHVEGDGPPLVVSGEAGSGKSALLANWIHEYRERSPEEPLIVHFVGASAESAAWDGMLGRLLDELSSVARQDFETPDQPQALRKTFARALYAAGARRRIILVIDGLNELEDRDQALDLAWLPPELPPGVSVILSTLPGRPLDEVKRRSWPVVDVGPLEPEERIHLIREYLARYRKSLSEEHLKRILANDPGGNPLFLRTVLEELRLHGDHETLGDVVDHYAESPNLPSLFERVLIRLEYDYERDRPGLVGEALTLLFAARRGLSEDEILDLLGRDGERLPRALWSPLHLAAGHLISNRSGLLGLRHQQMKEAVAVRYLGPEVSQTTVHRQLADYFQAREWGPRRAEELPWQLARAEAWAELADLLGNLDFLDAAWNGSGLDVRRYWTEIERNSDRRLAHQYREAVESPTGDGKGSWELASLLGSMGHSAEAGRVQLAISRKARKAEDGANLMASLGNQARFLQNQGQWQDARSLFRVQEELARKLGHQVGLATALGGQAGIHRVTGALDAALDLYQKEAELRRNAGDQVGLQYCLGNQALVLVEKADMEGALGLRMEQERLAREIGEIDGIRMAMEAQSVILRMTGELALALKKNREAEAICRGLGDRSGLATTLINQGEILRESGDAAGGMALYQEAEAICRAMGEKQDLAVTINNQAAIHLEHGEVEEASRCYRECEEICRSLGYSMGLQAALGNQGQIALHRGEAAAALAFTEEQESLCRAMNYPLGLAQCLNLKGTALNMMGRSTEAQAAWEEARELVGRHGLRRG